ncbi:MAG: hypothetical protein WA655_11375 [Candidatus Korobacteraceae bacterium]
MKGPGIICWLWFGLCCPALFGQKALLSDASTGAGALTPPAIAAHTSPAVHALASVGRSATYAEVAALPAALGLPHSLPMFQVAQPYAADAVCTQAIPPMLFRQSDYAFSRIQFNASAIRGTLTHDNLVKMARNFVPGQPLPDAPYYVPLSKRQKFDAFLHSIHTVGFGVGVLTDSFISQASGAYPRFGGGMEGYGQRLGAAAAGETSAAFFSGFVFPTLLHQDPRYFRSHQDAISDRLAYAASRVIIGRSDSGHNVINLSAIMSQFAQAAVSNAYIPYRNETVSGTLENAVAGLGAVAQANILNEFWPDIKEFFFRHNPESLLVRHKDAYPDQLASK